MITKLMYVKEFKTENSQSRRSSSDVNFSGSLYKPKNVHKFFEEIILSEQRKAVYTANARRKKIALKDLQNIREMYQTALKVIETTVANLDKDIVLKIYKVCDSPYLVFMNKKLPLPKDGYVYNVQENSDLQNVSQSLTDICNYGVINACVVELKQRISCGASRKSQKSGIEELKKYMQNQDSKYYRNIDNILNNIDQDLEIIKSNNAILKQIKPSLWQRLLSKLNIY